MPFDAASLAPDRLLAGRYRLIRLLDRGGMAEVWEAEDTVLARPVAVKSIHAHLATAETFLARFRREAVAAARLAHPGIVATFDTGEDNGRAFIVMELVRGRTLRALLDERRPSPAESAAIAFQVADALEHAHRHGVVHRDIKPANILVGDEPGHLGPRAKVTDFGIAKLAAATGARDLTQTGAVIGTAKYLSPEQVQGREPDARSDVYALGVVLYEMLCGRPPFTADTDLATAMHHVQTAPDPPRGLCPDVPEALEDVVLRALAKDPEDRPPSAAAFAEELAATGLVDDAVPAVSAHDRTPPAGVVPGLRRRRKRLVPAVLVAAVTAGVGAVAALLVLAPAGGNGGGALSGAAPVPIARVTTLDPRDGQEKEERARFAVDGDPGTSWETSRYSNRKFGNLKAGVGIVFQLQSPTQVAELEVSTKGTGWSAAVYVADQPAADLGGWGEPTAVVTNGSAHHRVELGGRRAGAVLLWITDLGPARKFIVTEARLHAP